MSRESHRPRYKTFSRYTVEEAAQWRGAALFNELPPNVLKTLDRLQNDYADLGERTMLLLALLLQKSPHEGHQWSAAISAASVGTRDAHLARPEFDLKADISVLETHKHAVDARLLEIRGYWREIQETSEDLAVLIGTRARAEGYVIYN